MKGIITGGAVLLVAGGLVLGASGFAGAATNKPKQQSTAKYAKTVCGVYSQLEADVSSYAQSLSSLDSGDPASFVPAATTQTNALLTKVQADEATLKGAYPNVSNGKKIGALLATNATQIDTALTGALGQLQAGGQASVTKFMVGIDTLTTKLTDPFSKVTDQDVIHALGKEKTCKNVVQVTG
jgi:hypothetical protein